MEEKTIKKSSLKSQSAWLLFAKVIGFGFAFLLPLIIVRFLTQEKVGVYRQVFQVIINAVAILPLGISMSAYYFLSREPENRAAAVLNILLFNFVMGGLACLGLYLYPQFLGNIFQSAEMTRLAPKIGVVIWLWIFSAFLETAAIANREARVATIFIILAQFSKTALLAGAVIAFGTIDSFVYAAMIQAALQTLILLFYLNIRFPRFWRAFDLRFFREHLLYALPFGFAALMWVLQTDVHNYFVGYRFSESDYAIYAYGCFQLPLLSMLYESTTAVLIPRMSELQSQNKKREMINLTARAMEKLSFFYLPVYVFMFVTAQVFIVTLFTRDYLASVPIFLINLTLLPLDAWVVDPVVRAFKELGRILLVARFVILIALIAALYFGIQHFDLRGMIAIVVVVSLIDKFVISAIVARRLEVKITDLRLLKNIGKTAFVSLIAGAVTYFVYYHIKEILPAVGTSLAALLFAAPKQSAADFIAGSLTLSVSALVFAPIYLFSMNLWGVIDAEEKEMLRSIRKKFFGCFKKSKIDLPSDSRPLTTDY